MKSITRVVSLAILATALVTFLLISLDSASNGRPRSSLPRILDAIFHPFRRQDGRPAEALLPREDKIVVVGKLSTEDTTWVTEDLSDWQSAVYVVNDTSAPLHTPMNKGREALAYLTYLIDNYDNLPKLIAFVHSHKEGYPLAWHTDAFRHSNVVSLHMLRASYVLKTGYVNLRCSRDPGCPEWLKPHEGRDEPLGEREMPTALTELFGADFKIPNDIASPCCAQFAVSRDRVLARPREDYVRFREWTMKSELSDEVLGRIWEYLWHIVFGMDPVFCPSYTRCLCNVYGRMCKSLWIADGGILRPWHGDRA